jgi:CheY-like chemotaxis protein
MNAILGITGIQLQDKGLPPKVFEALTNIHESGSWLLNVINGILDYSKIETGMIDILPANYDLPGLISDAAQINRMVYESKPITFVLEVGENIPRELLGDELKIKQILNNLLSNAYKYTEKGEVRLRVDVTDDDKREDGAVLTLRVSDTGQGMTPAQTEMVYNKYARFNLERNRSVIGTGLGMNITKRLVELMDGEISARSELDKGSVFTVTVPQGRVDDEVCSDELINDLKDMRYKRSATTAMTQIAYEYMPYGNVLIVDDVEINLHVAEGIMLPYGLGIEKAESGFEALARIERGERYDIIFMDIMMPLMDGVETTRRLRQLGYTGTVIALTANALNTQAEKYAELGFDGFISKPVDIRVMDATLNAFIRDRQPKAVLDEARKRKKGMKPKLSVDMREVFVRDAERTLRAIEALDADDGQSVSLFVTTVHGMRSALANIGERELSAVAEVLEQAGRDGALHTVEGKLRKFTERLMAITGRFKESSKPPKKKCPEPTDDEKEYLRRSLQSFIQECGELNRQAAKAVLTELRQREWHERVNKGLESIGVHLLHSAFNEAVAEAEGIIEGL